jgi:hypothetical protein
MRVYDSRRRAHRYPPVRASGRSMLSGVLPLEYQGCDNSYLFASRTASLCGAPHYTWTQPATRFRTLGSAAAKARRLGQTGCVGDFWRLGVGSAWGLHANGGLRIFAPMGTRYRMGLHAEIFFRQTNFTPHRTRFHHLPLWSSAAVSVKLASASKHDCFRIVRGSCAIPGRDRLHWALISIIYFLSTSVPPGGGAVKSLGSSIADRVGRSHAKFRN